MRSRVDRDRCAGCGLCVQVCPAVFEIDDQGRAVVRCAEVPAEHERACLDAVDMCPGEAIQIAREAVAA